MKRIGIYLGISSSSGGMFQYSQSLLDALEKHNKKNYEIVVIAADDEWKENLSNSSFSVYGIKYPYLSSFMSKIFVGLFFPPKIAIALSKIFNPVVREIKNLDLDIIIFPNQDYLSFQIDNSTTSTISTIHDLMHLYESRFPEVNSGLRHFYRQYRYKNICKFSNIILVDSEVGKKQVMESYKVNSNIIFSLPYVPPKYIYENNNYSNRLSLPDKFLFYPAQFWEHKNHALLLKSLAKVKKNHADIKLVVTGRKNALYKTLKVLVNNLDIEKNVIFEGKIDDKHMSTYYRNARALIFPSFFGPTNIPPLEAIACGCPMALSNIYAMPDQAQDASIYFDPLSLDSLSKSIELLWTDDDLCSDLVLNGKRVHTLWNHEHFSQKIFDILESMN